MPSPAAKHTALPPLVLASSSPRRRQLLRRLGLPFEIAVPEVAELTDSEGLAPDRLALENARLKAAAAADGRSLVIGADTVVMIDGLCLGKPVDLADAVRMLRMLAGRVHKVITAVAFSGPAHLTDEAFHVVTEVEFLPLDDGTISAYLANIDPLDKAGGYAAQDHGDLIIRRLNGPLDNVIGLPLNALANRLAAMGYPVPPDPAAPAP